MPSASDTTTATNPGRDGSYRLPRNVEPVRYRLEIEPDFERSVFSGSVDIDLLVHEEVDEIVLNAAELSITGATVAAAGADPAPATVSIDAPRERARVSPSIPLPVGDATLSITFNGPLTDQVRGFYLSTFKTSDGATSTVATTKLFLANARRVFPCWDEPDRKATFKITLVIDDDLTAVSNAPIAGEEQLHPESGASKRRVHFAPTAKISTYLVAFVVGPLEITDPVDASGTPVRVVHAPGRGHLAAYALDAAQHAVAFFNEYTGIPYPFEKLDLVGIPDFPGGGAENPGCVTFHEASLLVDPLTASRVELERVATVVHHEIAHMWFGNLVTMDWWDGAWLNEAFATFMDLLSVDAYRPEWERWTTFGMDRDGALSVDGLHATRPIEYHVESPDDALGMFDVLTYQKGGSVLRMLEQYLGADPFRDAVRYYLRSHAFGNSVTSDFWEALEQVSDEPIRAVAESWILQGGHPLVHVNGSTLSQEPFSYLPSPRHGDSAIGNRWQVPLLVRDVDAGAPEEAWERLLLGGEPISIGSVGSGLLLANAGGWGAYRVTYSSGALQALAGRWTALQPLERCDLVSDTWALVLAERMELGELFDLASRVGDEEQPGVYRPLVAALDLCQRIARDGARDAVATATRTLLGSRLAALGWEPKPGESVHIPALRALLLRTLGTLGRDATVREEAARRFAAAHAGGAPIEPDLEPAILSVVADLDREDDYEAILECYRHPSTPQQERRCLAALSEFPDTVRCLHTFEMARTEARSVDRSLIVRSLLANPVAGPAIWQRVKSTWNELLETMPKEHHALMVSTVPTLCADPALAEDIDSFITRQGFASNHRTVRQTLERLAVNVRLADRLRDGGRLEAALARVRRPTR